MSGLISQISLVFEGKTFGNKTVPGYLCHPKKWCRNGSFEGTDR